MKLGLSCPKAVIRCTTLQHVDVDFVISQKGDKNMNLVRSTLLER